MVISKNDGFPPVRVSELEIENDRKKKTHLHVRIDRRTEQIKLDDIRYIESFGDYVKIHCQDASHITKEGISAIESRLSNAFVRIHRSFIVNKEAISSYNREYVMLKDLKLAIGRKYKKEVRRILVATVE